MIAAGLDALAEASLWSMSTDEVGQLVVAVERIDRRVSAAQVAVLAQADRSGIADQTGASSTAVWLHNVADLAGRGGSGSPGVAPGVGDSAGGRGRV